MDNATGQQGRRGFIRNALFVMLAVMPLLLCSCMTVKFSKEYGLTSERLPLVTGKWRNTQQPPHHVGTLWEELTREKSSPDAVVVLEMPDKRTLTATLLTDGVKTDSRTFRIRRRALWLELPTQHVASPFLWYVIWGLETYDPAIGIDRNGDLWVYTRYSGVLTIVVPTFIGSGCEWIHLFERAE